MENTALVALSQQMALRRQMDVIANNIANANTTGFKAERAVFNSFLQDLGDGQTLAFVDDVTVVRDPSDGPLTATGNPLDVAIRGDAYFEVETPDGVRFTRGGHLRIDADGALVNADGYPVLASDGFPILTIPGDTEITIARDGTVASESGEIGRLHLVTFDNSNVLIKVGGGLYATDATPDTAVDAEVAQGFLEGSNVEPIVEMTRMITVLRSYQAAQKLVQEADDLMRQAISTLAELAAGA